MLDEEAVLLARHLAVAALAFLLVPAVALADATGDLAQKPGPTGCFSSAGADECTAASGLLVAEAVATSPDGRNVYAAGSGSNAVAVFDRGADGALTQKEGAAGCVSLLGLGPCAAGTAIAGANSVTVSPDGRNVYVAGFLSGAVAVFDRADDGTLTQKPGSAGCVSALPSCSAGKAIVGPEAVVVSPDGRSLYVASTFSGAVAVFDRSADGTLTQKPGQAGCVSDTGLGPCADGSALDGAASVSVSPDGRNVYAAAINSGAVTVFDRAADGTLTQKPGQAGCTSEAGTAPCSGGPGLGGAAWVTVSPDGRNAYVASFESAAVAVFDRGGSGELTQKPGTAGCLGKDAACSPGRALDGALAVTVSPDGRSVYATGSVNDAVAAFDRGADGTLAQKSGPAGCISETGAGACADGSGLGGAGSVVVTPDGRSAYVGAVVPGALSVFDRRPAGSSLAPNATGPRLSGLKLSKKRFHAASVGPRIAFRSGVRVSYRLSKPAAVSFRVESARPGRRHGYRTLRGHLMRRGQAGRNATRFRGPLAGRRLPAGRYRLRAVATDADGNTSHPKHRRFRVVRR